MAIAVFLIVAFGSSWAIAWGLQATGGPEAAGAMTALWFLAFMFGPAIGALVAAGLFDRDRFLQALSLRPIRWKAVIVWVLLGWAIAIVLVIAALGVTLLVLGQPPADAAARLAEQVQAQGVELPMSAEALLWLTILVNVPIGIVINTILITANEELGWRGWLQPRLKRLGFWPVSIVIGVIWGLWHAPIILMGHNYPGMGWTGVGLMVVFTTLVSPYYTLVRERSGHVVPAGALHGAMNATAAVGILFTPETGWPWNGLVGAAGFAVMFAGWALIALYRRSKPVVG
ncbi:MAG: CPBP family intramembrane glutamic endopeptidase [Oceanicaulis sp.]